MQIEYELKLDFDDVLIKPKRSTLDSRAEVDLMRTYKMLHSNEEWSGIPIIAANMDTVGTFDMVTTLNKHKACVALHKHYALIDIYSKLKYLRSSSFFITVGINKEGLEIITKLSDMADTDGPPFLPMINVDVANGYTANFHKQIKEIRKILPYSIIMAGNVATPEMVQQLLECGADIVKIGIGGGSVCTTRVKTGCGVPQLSAIIDCADAAHGYGGLVCADGGCRTAGEIAKAFGAGADFVMIGGMLAGTDECEGEWDYETLDTSTNPPQILLEKKKKKLLRFYGMSSKNAQEKYNGGVAKHRTDEGKCVKIPYKGSAEGVILDIFGGLRSACTYVGAKRLKDLSKCTTFIRCTNTHNKVYGE